MELTLNTYNPQRAEAGCRSCLRVFASDEAFDMHRTGDYERGRQCAENPAHRGLELDNKGRWRRARNEAGRAKPPEKLTDDDWEKLSSWLHHALYFRNVIRSRFPDIGEPEASDTDTVH